MKDELLQNAQQPFEIVYEYAPTPDAQRRIRQAYELIFDRIEKMKDEDKVYD